MRRAAGDIRTRTFLQWINSLPYNSSLYSGTPIINEVTAFEDEQEFAYRIYPQSLLNIVTVENYSGLAGRAILAMRNETVAKHNNEILDRFPGQERLYYSVNRATMNGEIGRDANDIDSEVLSSIESSSVPQSVLRLKVGCPVMLMRNLYPNQGLCNGTRLILTYLGNKCLKGRIISGNFAGNEVLIPRFSLSTQEKEFDFVLTRKQFPIRLAFAMSVNKSQGQSLEHVGVDLTIPAFAHGQLYVALSRTTNLDGLCILVAKGSRRMVNNEVWPEVLLRSEED